LVYHFRFWGLYSQIFKLSFQINEPMSDISNCPNCPDGGFIVNSGGCCTCMSCSWSACPSG
jgi:hypothetical protein